MLNKNLIYYFLNINLLINIKIKKRDIVYLLFPCSLRGKCFSGESHELNSFIFISPEKQTKKFNISIISLFFLFFSITFPPKRTKQRNNIKIWIIRTLSIIKHVLISFFLFYTFHLLNKLYTSSIKENKNPNHLT